MGRRRKVGPTGHLGGTGSRERLRRVVGGALGRLSVARDEVGGEAYWETRHARHGRSLRAVGNLGLSERQNEEDYAMRWEHTSRALATVVPESLGRALLDAGCGSGTFSRRYAEAGFSVVGVDVAPAAIAAAALSCEGEFLTGDISRLDLGREFAVVACHNVLMCIVDDEEARAAIGNLVRMIEPGGHLLIQEGVREEGGARQPTHVRLRTVAEHGSLLSETGLEIVRQETFPAPHEPLPQQLVLARKDAFPGGSGASRVAP